MTGGQIAFEAYFTAYWGRPAPVRWEDLGEEVTRAWEVAAAEAGAEDRRIVELARALMPDLEPIYQSIAIQYGADVPALARLRALKEALEASPAPAIARVGDRTTRFETRLEHAPGCLVPDGPQHGLECAVTSPSKTG